MGFSFTKKRKKSFASQGGLCYYCGRDTKFERWTMDHILPRCRGGNSRKTNIVGCCNTCNQAKGNMNLAEFVETTYLKEDRRIALGATKPPSMGYKEAARRHEERMPKLNLWQKFKKYLYRKSKKWYWKTRDFFENKSVEA